MKSIGCKFGRARVQSKKRALSSAPAVQAVPLAVSSDLLNFHSLSIDMAPSQTARDAVKRRFYNEGITVTEWARANDFDVNLVYGVLSGRSRAQRGESHRIAIALGLKKNEEEEGLKTSNNPPTKGQQ